MSVNAEETNDGGVVIVDAVTEVFLTAAEAHWLRDWLIQWCDEEERG